MFYMFELSIIIVYLYWQLGIHDAIEILELGIHVLVLLNSEFVRL